MLAITLNSLGVEPDAGRARVPMRAIHIARSLAGGHRGAEAASR
jgi:hypothetical protein